MKIGIVSDSHGRLDRLERAVAAMVARGAEGVVHCGDIGGADCLAVLGRSGAAAYAVGGNMDRDLPHLAQSAQEAGVQFDASAVQVPLPDGRRLIATHSHDRRLMHDLLAGGQFAYLCHGHTHRRRDDRLERMRIINPGALHHVHQPSVALLDTETDELVFIEDF